MFARILSFFSDHEEVEQENKKQDSDPNKKSPANTLKGRIAVYDNLRSHPRIINVTEKKPNIFIDTIAEKTYDTLEKKGSNIPFSTINEIIENLIHANFQGVVISVLPEGKTIQVSDQGPGIEDKEKAIKPGFSTADEKMQEIIKGVGSGLPIARESISFIGGKMTIDNNLKNGTVITITTDNNEGNNQNSNYVKQEGTSTIDSENKIKGISESSKLELKDKLSKRQKKVLMLLAENEMLGPSKVTAELNISLSTAYRDLRMLEEHNLVFSDEQGKRKLTETGLKFISRLFE